MLFPVKSYPNPCGGFIGVRIGKVFVEPQGAGDILDRVIGMRQVIASQGAILLQRVSAYGLKPGRQFFISISTFGE
ncbi:hypothetical protein VRB93_09270 [Erwinia aphidicola]